MGGSPWNWRTDPLGLQIFLAMKPQTQTWSENKSVYSFTSEVIAVFPSVPFGKITDLQNSSLRFPGVPVGWDMTEGWLSPWRLTKSKQNCQESWSTFHWSPVGARLLRVLELWGEGGSRIWSFGELPHLVPSPSLLWCSPDASSYLKGPEWLEYASRNVREI
jgi:hypothetical protein